MMFLGMTFGAGAYSLDDTVQLEDAVMRIQLSNGDFDRMYIDNQPSSYTGMPDSWLYTTVMDARFDGTLTSGNTGYAVENTEALRIKRRVAGEAKWITLHTRNISTEEDFSFIYIDRTAASGVQYEYAVVPVCGGSEGAAIIRTVNVEFDGIHLMGAATKESYHTMLDVEVNVSRNRPSSVIQTMNRRYPFVVSNNAHNYDSGSISAVFIRYNTATRLWDTDGAIRYRKELYDFLYDGQPKLIKTDDGRVWIASITGESISESKDGSQHKVVTGFEFTEIADSESEVDLAEYGFIGTED